MRRWVLDLWRWSWVLTLPIAVIFLYWSWSTAHRYHDFVLRFDPGRFSAELNLHSLGREEWGHIWRRFKVSMLSDLGGERSENGVKQIAIYAQESELAKLDQHLPESGFEYVKAALRNGDELQKVKIRYRGDFYYHWFGEKKSLRIKTKRGSLYDGMRKFNLIVPKSAGQLHNFLGYQLAEVMGLIGPKSELVELVLNGKPHGLYILVEQLEESTLRRNGLMPGDMYAGELVAKDAYTGASQKVIENPGLWRKVSINNHFPEDSVEPLKRFLQLITAPQTEDTQKAISEMLDMEAWGKFMAYTILAQTFHFDETHNWRLYYDPWRSKFIPVVWDPSSWRWHQHSNREVYPDIITSEIHEVLYKNTNFLLARHNAIREFYTSGVEQEFLSRVDKALQQASAVTLRDPNLRHGGPQKYIDSMNKLSRVIHRVNRDLKGVFLSNSSKSIKYAESDESGLIKMTVSGRAPIEGLTFEYDKPLGHGVSISIGYLNNGDKHWVDVTGDARIMGRLLEINTPLLSRFEVFKEGDHPLFDRRVNVLPAYYEVKVSGLPDQNGLVDVFFGDGGRTSIRVESESKLEVASFDGSYPIIEPMPLAPMLTWSGDIEIDGLVTIDEPLIIEPGTNLLMGEDSALIFRDRLYARGTKERPIRFMPRPGNKRPWGAVALQGEKSNGSRLKHCYFSEGSGIKDSTYEYSAMLSIHDVQDVEINNCEFNDSQIVDDMVHTVYSKVRFVDTVFNNSKSDALDLDISEAVLERCEFYGSGNDAIDLMTTKAILVDSKIANSGDKGVSVGEGSMLLSINNLLEENGIGVQSKDGSIAALVNTSLVNNARSLDAYKKNWRYDDGGSIFVYKGSVVGSGITADKHSSVKIRDSFVSTMPFLGKKEKKRIILEPDVDQLDMYKAASSVIKRFPKEENAVRGFGRSYWKKIRLGARGAVVNAN